MPEWTRCRPVRPGDLVGVCAPAGAVDTERLEGGVAALGALGYRVRLGASAGRRHRFFAGTHDERRRDLEALLADPEVAAVFCARGGTGAGWLLPELEAGHASPPKLIVGYSDVTFLHLWRARQRVTSLHGPMVAHELEGGRFEAEPLRWALTGEGALPALGAGDGVRPLRTGEAEGVLRGGCLSILAGACGTPWALETAGEPSILFLEDLDEKPYRVDRLLMQLRQSGALSGVEGVVFGRMEGCFPSPEAGYALEDVVREALEGLDVPVAMGLSSGHTTSSFISLPLGVRARLLCDAEARLELLEPPV